MNNAILATEIFGMLALGVIMYGSVFETKQISKKKSAFQVLVFSVFLTLGIDAISYLPLQWKEMPGVHFAVTLAAFVSPFIVYSLFLQYIYLHISSKAQVSRKLFLVGEIYCIIGVVFSAFYGWRGQLFVLDGGVYQNGEYYEGYMMTYVIVLAYTMLLVFGNVRKIGLHDAMAAIFFMVVPIVFVVINLLYPEMGFSVATLSLSMLIIQVMLQSERESNLLDQEQKSSKLAHYDELTGIQNRLAFSEVCDRMTDDGNVGVVFADINGLKYANDHFGHKAGDELIQGFSRELLAVFRKDDLFRISGDEFVVLLLDVPQELFERKTKILHANLDEQDVPMASVGFEYGKKSEISRLIDMAEEKMYVEKKSFHEKFPMYSRNA